MSDLYRVKKYFSYKLRARDEHSIHSPFVFKLYTEVIDNKEKHYTYDELAKIREQLLNNTQIIEVTDLGAGSKKMGNSRKISYIARYSVVNQKYGELLFRLVNYFRPQHILELGTSLGLSALYMHKAAPNAEIITIEGCPNTHSFAKRLIETHLVPRPSSLVPNIICNSFDAAFEQELACKKFDFVYIDGNHTYEATIRYFHELLNHTNEKSVLLFDDIYWSEGMEKAWEEIKAHPAVTVTIDLYKVGLVFFRKENKQKEDFILRF
jgi:predicted O-methyltransferase YrrM